MTFFRQNCMTQAECNSKSGSEGKCNFTCSSGQMCCRHCSWFKTCYQDWNHGSFRLFFLFALSLILINTLFTPFVPLIPNQYIRSLFLMLEWFPRKEEKGMSICGFSSKISLYALLLRTHPRAWFFLFLGVLGKKGWLISKPPPKKRRNVAKQSFSTPSLFFKFLADHTKTSTRWHQGKHK